MTEPTATAIGRDEISAAAARVAPYIRRTPILHIEAGVLAAVPLDLKLECLQVTGSFKARGILHRVLTAEHVPDAGVIAASGGNAGLAAAWAARTLGHRAEIFVPVSAPAVKVARLRELGADVHQVGSSYAEALEASAQRAAQTGALVVHAYDQREVVAGQGGVAIEIEADVPDVDTVLVAVGGGGLIGGVAGWFGDRVKVVGVEPEGCPTLHAALDAGEPVDVDVSGVAADSLGAGRLGKWCWEARRFIDASLVLPGAAITDAQRRLWQAARVVAEPGGAAALAAITSGAYVPGDGERIVVVVCGANAELGDLMLGTAG